jgi:hypothetical protein
MNLKVQERGRHGTILAFTETDRGISRKSSVAVAVTGPRRESGEFRVGSWKDDQWGGDISCRLCLLFISCGATAQRGPGPTPI